MSRPTYSWILPIFDEAPALSRLIPRIVAASRPHPFEIIAINDASTDSSLRTIKTLTKKFPVLKIVSLPSHQGKWPALATGLRRARGRIIITLDADLQDDPREFPKLTPYLKQGYDFISGWRFKRRDPVYKILISLFGNWLISLVTGHQFHDLNAPFKVFRHSLLKHLPLTGSLFRFSLLFAYKLGFHTLEVPIRHHSRRFGHSKFGLIKYVRILYDLIVIIFLFTGSNRLSKIKS